jgi:ABC-type multidrug transport system fused ATPase/permease subunit
MDLLGRRNTNTIEPFLPVQAELQVLARKTSHVRIFQNVIPNTILDVGFVAMIIVSIAWRAHLRVRHFVILTTYMNLLRAPLQSVSSSLPKFLGLVVNFERVFQMIQAA